jgi:hypothetical protein
VLETGTDDGAHEQVHTAQWRCSAAQSRSRTPQLRPCGCNGIARAAITSIYFAEQRCTPQAQVFIAHGHLCVPQRRLDAPQGCLTGRRRLRVAHRGSGTHCRGVSRAADASCRAAEASCYGAESSCRAAGASLQSAAPPNRLGSHLANRSGAPRPQRRLRRPKTSLREPQGRPFACTGSPPRRARGQSRRIASAQSAITSALSATGFSRAAEARFEGAIASLECPIVSPRLQ